MRTNTSSIALIAKNPGAAAADGVPIKKLIRRQMNQAGNILLAALEPFDDDDFYAAGLNGISPAWTVGHLGCVLDLFTTWIEPRELCVEPWKHEIFNSLAVGKASGTKAELVDRAKLPKAEVLLLFRQAQVRALELLEAFDEDEWDIALPAHAPDSLPTRGAIWQALGVHTFWHLGELSGCIPKFHGTYTLNTVAHYFYAPPGSRPPVSGARAIP